MANDYGDLEQLVNDVTSLDTARMTLRWALERLNTIEKEKADLKKNLAIAEETSKKLQLKEASLTDAYSSRTKTLEEKEDFYTKLEATMSLLGEGKLDIQQLLKKEAKLDSMRRSLESEYSDKFEELDRNQRSVIERWNARLLEVESQYAGRLAEAQQKYDGLRSELESGYQGRLTSLQASFKAREKELSDRINSLETSVHLSEEKVETRRRELETEYLAKKRENEENYRKLRGMLEGGLEEKLRSMDSDHAAQVRSLETSWQTERARLLEEQRVRDEQFISAQARIKEIENKLAAQQEAHHTELLKLISEKETAFRAQLAELEKEKAAKEETVKELVARLEKKASDWEAEKARLEAEFGGRLALMEQGVRERAAALEREYTGKKEELENIIAVNREETEKEFKARLLVERQAMDAEKARLETEKALREEALARGAARLKQLEDALSASYEEHHTELMERIRSGETAFREKLDAFAAEKRSYNEAINKLTDELRARDTALLEEKGRIAGEFEAKAGIYEERIARMEASFEERRRDYEQKMNALSASLGEASKLSALEKENFKNEVARISAETAALADERAAAVRADYEARKAELAREFEARYSDRLNSLEAEKVRMEELLIGMERQVSEARAGSRKLESELAGRAAELEADFAVRRERLEADLRDRNNALHAEAEAKMELERRNWQAERARLENQVGEVSGNFRAAQKEIEDLNSGLRKSAEANAANEAAFNRELMEAKANYDRELTYRVKDAVDVQTAHLVEALEAGRVRQESLAAVVGERDNLISALKAEMAEMRRDWEERIRTAVSEAMSARRAELEKDYTARRASLTEEFEFKNSRLTEENAALRKSLEKAAAESAGAMSARRAELEKDYAARRVAMSEEFELKNSRLAEENAALKGSLEKAAAEAAEAAAVRRAELEEDYAARRAALSDEFAIKNSRLSEENAALKEALGKVSAVAGEANSRAAELTGKLLAAEKAAAAEKLEMQKAQVRELDAVVADAVAAAVEALEQKLRSAHDELDKEQKINAEEVRHLQESFSAEKERMLEEMDRRERYIESADIKIQDLEREMMKYRQSASGELMKQISEQDDRFRMVVAEEKARGEAKMKQLENLLSAKEKMLADGDKFYRQKQMELDTLHSDFNLRVNKFNEELFAQKQELGEKEKALNEYKLELEKSYAVKAAEMEKMKAELTRVIMDYKSRK